MAAGLAVQLVMYVASDATDGWVTLRRMIMRKGQDGYGRAMLDHFHGREAWEIVERDDGNFSIGAGPELYFAPFRNWRPVERQAMRYVRGRVLDVGCGAGRVMLHLQERGMEVVGIDNSPSAIETCRLRGAKNTHVLPIERLGPKLGTFDTVLMLGGNLGLLGTPERGRRLLRKLHRLTTDSGRIIGASRDRTRDDDPDVRAYVQRNRRLGRLSGQSRLRIRYRRFATPWFDFFRIAPDELEDLVDGTGWHAGVGRQPVHRCDRQGRITDPRHSRTVRTFNGGRPGTARAPHRA
ncbi:MAG: class I SAM-dependent methyltransferase [Actinomycetota bacterium]|nr:class I SAM-dependent methyltransferase [Actinomycetota bacterium]